MLNIEIQVKVYEVKKVMMVTLQNLGTSAFIHVNLPATQEEINKANKAINPFGTNDVVVADVDLYEEFCMDGVKLELYRYHIEQLNQVAHAILKYGTVFLLVAEAMDGLHNLKEICNVLEEGSYTIYNASSEEEFGEVIVESLGILNLLPEHLRYYFDCEAYGRDYLIENNVTKIGNLNDSCYVEIHN